MVRNGSKPTNVCLYCGKTLKRKDSQFCCSEHFNRYKYEKYIEKWKNGEENGMKGEYGIANAVKKYILEKNDCKCEICKKNYINPYTKLSVLQIHHIDGDCTNNKENNLQLLCPTHHAMTENFGSRNKKATRKDKRKRS